MSDDESTLYESYHSHHHLDGKRETQVQCATQVPQVTKVTIEKKKTTLPSKAINTQKTLPVLKRNYESLAIPSLIFPDDYRSSVDETKPSRTTHKVIFPKTPSCERKGVVHRKSHASKLVQTVSGIVSPASKWVDAGTNCDLTSDSRRDLHLRDMPLSFRGAITPLVSTRARDDYSSQGSGLTINSCRYSRKPSSIMAALEAPCASHRHSRCMAQHSCFKSSTPTNNRVTTKPKCEKKKTQRKIRLLNTNPRPKT